MAETIRINKLVAQRLGIGRRKADDLIAERRVRVDGDLVQEAGLRVDPFATIAVDGEVYGSGDDDDQTLIFHKPIRVVTSWADDEGRTDLSHFFPDRPPALRYAGRLDFMTEGLLVLSTDGDLVHQLTHPRYEVEREYLAWVTGRLTEAQVEKIKRFSLNLHSKREEQIRLRRKERYNGGECWSLTLWQGENRQIRNAFESVDVRLKRLMRIRHGAYELGRLQAGDYREVDPLG